MNFSLHTASQAHLTSFSLPKETPTSLLEKSTASYNDVPFTGLIFPPTLLQDSLSLFWLHASGLFASHPSQQILCTPGGQMVKNLVSMRETPV